jgi:hypothetical protein
MDSRLSNKQWRLEHLYKIVNKDAKLVTFQANKAQKDFQKNHALRNIILKSRRLGFTTYEAIDALDDTLFTPNFESILLSYDSVSQLDCFDSKILTAWNNLPERIKALYTLDADRANKLKFNWGEALKSTSSISVRTHGRSGSFNRLHVSEFGKICKQNPSEAKEIISGTVSAIPLSTGRVDFESTAEGDYGLFHDMFWEAYNRGEPRYPGEYKALFYNWTYEEDEINKIIPLPDSELPLDFQEYQKEHNLTRQQVTYYYFKWLSYAKDWEILKQEYPTTPEEAFATSGDRFFPRELIDKFVTREPLNVVGHWKYYANYNPGHRYAIGADPSGGRGGDNATIAVWDFDAKPKPEVVALYACDTISPDTFAYEITAIGRAFGNPIACVERNGLGYSTLAILKTMYYNIYKEEDLMSTNSNEANKLGWVSSGNAKYKMFYDFRSAVNEQAVNIPDDIAKQELRSFPKDNIDIKRNSAGVRVKEGKDASGKHWDRVSSILMGYQMMAHASKARGVVIIGGNDDSKKTFNKFSIF